MKITSQMWATAFEAARSAIAEVLGTNESELKRCAESSAQQSIKMDIKVTLDMSGKTHDLEVKLKADPIQQGVSDKRSDKGEDPDQGLLPGIPKKEKDTLAGAFTDSYSSSGTTEPASESADGSSEHGAIPPEASETPETKGRNGRKGRKPKAE